MHGPAFWHRTKREVTIQPNRRVQELFRCAAEFGIGEDMGDPSLSRDCPLDCKVYVGNLGNSGNKTELERAFGYYGPLRSVWVARNPPGFAFVEFEDPRDATDAVRELDGRTLCGCRVQVEMSSGEKRSRYRGPPPSWNRRPRDDYRRRSPPPRRRSPRRRSFSRSRSRSLSRERRRERSLSRDRNHKPSRSFSRSRSRSRSNGRK
uniref:Serine/arginine-rich splicing factor 3 n=2 Tax=Sinocyclocheilus anshuiensis TaxID=1608454 RepID=A0A671QRR6_9TELE